MIANCAQLGLDWERASLSAYWEAIEAHNEAQAPTPKVSEGFKQMMMGQFGAN